MPITQPRGLFALAAAVFALFTLAPNLSLYGAKPAPTAAVPAAAAAAAPVAPPAPSTPAPQTPSSDADASAKSSLIENAVVRIFSSVRAPEPLRPWSKASPTEISGSGVVIEGKRILTNAHVVLYATDVQVQGNQLGDKISASVVAVDPGIDLAILKLDDESFFDTHPPLARAPGLPGIKDAVLVYGFPTGGSSLSITKGIVSRIEFTTYTYPESGVRVQIDAAINPGNSGGPAVVGDRMVGIAFSHLRAAQNIGYIIPSEEVDLFLQRAAKSHGTGKVTLFAEFQTLENPALKTYLGLDRAVQGIVVLKPDEDNPAYPLKSWDVITKIGDAPIDDEGMVKVGEIRLKFLYMIQHAANDQKVPLTVIRAGKTLQLNVPVVSQRPLLIPDLAGGYPSYFVYGPVCFSTATNQLMGSLFGEGRLGGLLNVLSALSSPLISRRPDKPAFPDEQLVIISSPFFPNRMTKGYSNPLLRVVKAVNGTQIRNLKHLVEVLRDARSPFIKIEFEGKGTETLIFPRADILKVTDEILTDNGVRSQASPDLLAVWNAKPTG